VALLCLSSAHEQAADLPDKHCDLEDTVETEMKVQLLQTGTSSVVSPSQNQTDVPVPPQKDIVVPVPPELGYLRYEFEVLGVKNPGLANSVEYSEFDLFEGDKKIEGWEMDQVYSPGAEHPEKAKFLVDNDCLTSFMDKRKI